MPTILDQELANHRRALTSPCVQRLTRLGAISPRAVAMAVESEKVLRRPVEPLARCAARVFSELSTDFNVTPAAPHPAAISFYGDMARTPEGLEVSLHVLAKVAA